MEKDFSLIGTEKAQIQTLPGLQMQKLEMEESFIF